MKELHNVEQQVHVIYFMAFVWKQNLRTVTQPEPWEVDFVPEILCTQNLHVDIQWISQTQVILLFLAPHCV